MERDNLKIKKCYYSFFVYEKNLSIPHISAHIYLGKNLFGVDSKRGDVHFFQETSYYVRNVKPINLASMKMAGIRQYYDSELDTLIKFNELLGSMVYLKRNHYMEALNEYLKTDE